MAGFPKTARLLRSSDFRNVYEHGAKFAGPLFTAFLLRSPEPEAGQPAPARVGFTVPRALGPAVDRNRIKRRMREAVRASLPQLGSRWQIVFNPRQRAMSAPLPELTREVEKLFRRCGAGPPPSSGSTSS